MKLVVFGDCYVRVYKNSLDALVLLNPSEIVFVEEWNRSSISGIISALCKEHNIIFTSVQPGTKVEKQEIESCDGIVAFSDSLYSAERYTQKAYNLGKICRILPVSEDKPIHRDHYTEYHLVKITSGISETRDIEQEFTKTIEEHCQYEQLLESSKDFLELKIGTKYHDRQIRITGLDFSWIIENIPKDYWRMNYNYFSLVIRLDNHTEKIFEESHDIPTLAEAFKKLEETEGWSKSASNYKISDLKIFKEQFGDVLELRYDSYFFR